MPNTFPDWLRQAKDAAGIDGEIFHAPDGSFCVWMDCWDAPPIFGIPSEELARQVVEAMYAMARSYADNEMSSA